MWHILIWHWSETVFGAGVIGLRNAGFFVFGIFDENKKRMRSLDWRQDKNYLDYIDSGESAAVYIVKNIVKSLDTKNMWVDVVSHPSDKRLFLSALPLRFLMVLQ